MCIYIDGFFFKMIVRFNLSKNDFNIVIILMNNFIYEYIIINFFIF